MLRVVYLGRWRVVSRHNFRLCLDALCGCCGFHVERRVRVHGDVVRGNRDRGRRLRVWKRGLGCCRLLRCGRSVGLLRGLCGYGLGGVLERGRRISWGC